MSNHAWRLNSTGVTIPAGSVVAQGATADLMILAPIGSLTCLGVTVEAVPTGLWGRIAQDGAVQVLSTAATAVGDSLLMSASVAGKVDPVAGGTYAARAMHIGEANSSSVGAASVWTMLQMGLVAPAAAAGGGGIFLANYDNQSVSGEVPHFIAGEITGNVHPNPELADFYYPAQNRLLAVSQVFEQQTTITELGAVIKAGVDQWCRGRIGIYTNTSNAIRYPKDLVAGSDAGDLAFDMFAADPLWVHVALGANLVLPAGRYWFSLVVDLRTIQQGVKFMPLVANNMEPTLGHIGPNYSDSIYARRFWNASFDYETAHAALPATFPAGAARDDGLVYAPGMYFKTL